MVITLGDARKIVAEYVGKSGKCPTSEDTRLFVLSVAERLLHEGTHGNLRKWAFCLCNGCFTAPPDMEIPLKVKVDGYPEKVWSKWYEFYDINVSDAHDKAYQPGLYEEVGEFYTTYDIPYPGARVAPIPLMTEAECAYIIIQGQDAQGRDVFTKCNGQRIHGEYIKISRDNPVFSQTIFTKITGIEKSQTCGPVRLYWQEVIANEVTTRGLLAEYRPTDVHPSFRRFRVPQAKWDCCVKVQVLGRVRLLDSYHDNDILPITGVSAIRQMAQLLHAENNEKIDVATYQQRAIDKTIENENQYHKTGDEPFDFFFETSPGSIENLQ